MELRILIEWMDTELAITEGWTVLLGLRRLQQSSSTSASAPRIYQMLNMVNGNAKRQGSIVATGERPFSRP